MKAVVKVKPERGVEIRDDLPTPEPIGERDIRVKVHAASVCGTDNELYNYSPAAAAFQLRLPVVLGHEGSGTVIETGSAVTGMAVGDKRRAGLAYRLPELLSVPDRQRAPVCEHAAVRAAHRRRVRRGVCR